MTGLILCGHGRFAQGIQDALQCILGELHEVVAVDFDTTKEESVFEEVLEQAIHTLADCSSILIACDLCGGTPYKTAVKLSFSHQALQVIGGVNLAVLIELCVRKEYAQELDISALLEEARAQLQLFAVQEESCDEED